MKKLSDTQVELAKFRKKLQRGDQARIAKKLGVHLNYVGMVLRGERNSPDIIAEAEKLIKSNEEFYNEGK